MFYTKRIKYRLVKSGALSKYLTDLVMSGFLSKDISYDFKGAPTKIAKYRVCDNYVRFALKYIEPNVGKIRDGYYKFNSLDSLNNWSSVLGLQFENLILKNKSKVLDMLQVDYNSILSCSPYFQTKTVKNKGSCQIDLLIVLKSYQIFLCEIKIQAKITSKVIEDIKRKIEVLKRPKVYTVQPVLIYCGEVAPKVQEAESWLRLVSVEDLMSF